MAPIPLWSIPPVGGIRILRYFQSFPQKIDFSTLRSARIALKKIPKKSFFCMRFHIFFTENKKNLYFSSYSLSVSCLKQRIFRGDSRAPCRAKLREKMAVTRKLQIFFNFCKKKCKILPHIVRTPYIFIWPSEHY